MLNLILREIKTRMSQDCSFSGNYLNDLLISGAKCSISDKIEFQYCSLVSVGSNSHIQAHEAFFTVRHPVFRTRR